MRPRAGQLPDRVPVMCQLSLGHYFLHAGGGAVEIWHDTAAFGDALLALQRRYGFDGILVNLPGRDPALARPDRRPWSSAAATPSSRWANGAVTTAPPDDNPHVRAAGGRGGGETRLRRRRSGAAVLRRAARPVRRDACREPDEIPAWQFDTIRYVRERAPDVSVHGEVFSPFSQWLELLDHADALMALVEDPARVTACLARLAEGAAALALGQAAAGADAILISSAFAGAGFISRRQYRAFVLPCERGGGRRHQGRAPGPAGLHAHVRRDRRPARSDGGDRHRRHRHAGPAAARDSGARRREGAASASGSSSRGTSTRWRRCSSGSAGVVSRGRPRAAGRRQGRRRVHPQQRLLGGAAHAAGEHHATGTRGGRGGMVRPDRCQNLAAGHAPVRPRSLKPAKRISGEFVGGRPGPHFVTPAGLRPLRSVLPTDAIGLVRGSARWHTQHRP